MRVSSRKWILGAAGGVLLGLTAVGVAHSLRGTRSSPAAPVPGVESADGHLTVSQPRWGPGARTLQFDVTYAGVGSDACCVCQGYNASGEPVGDPVEFTTKTFQDTTLSLDHVGKNVAWVQVSLR